MTINEIQPKWYYTYGTYPIDGQSDLTRKMGDYNLGQFIKEVGQNVLDAILRKNLQIELFFDLIKVPKEKKGDVLKLFNINVTEMEDKFNSMSEIDHNEAYKFQRMKQIIIEDNDFFILRITDRNTCGLTGDLKDKKSRFFGFFWFLGISNKSGGQGGSYGEGRLAILRCSKIQMLLAISHLSDTGIYRKYGSAYHGPFEAKDDSLVEDEGESVIYRGIAYYGKNPNKRENRAFPIESTKYNDKDPLFPEELKENNNYGTSFYYPFYDFSSHFEDYKDETDKISDWSEHIINQIQNWFFPAVAEGLLKVAVRMFEFPNIKEASDGRIINYLDETNINPVFKIFKQSAKYKTIEVPLEIPTGKRGEKLKRICELKMAEIDADSDEYIYLSNYQLQNSLALSRNNMIINYEKMKYDFISEKNFFAVLVVNKEEAVEFVRASEPPQHNKWNPNSDRLKDRYGSVGANCLRTFLKEIKDILKKEYGFADIGSDEIPNQIIKHLMKFISSDLEIEKKKSKKPKSLNIKKINKTKKGVKDKDGKGGVIVHIPTEGPEIPPPEGPREEPPPEDDKSGREIDEGISANPLSKVSIVNFSKEDRLEIVTILPINFLSERDSKNGYIEAEVFLPEDFEEIFEYLIINPYVLHGTDWLKLPVYIQRKLIRYHGLKIKDMTVFPLKVKIDLRNIPEILRDLPRIEAEAFACIKKGV